jgi:signal transduction histidine kinase
VSDARSKVWSVIVFACLAALALAALTLPQSFLLTALSDVIQCLLLFAGAICFVPRALRSQGRLRLFWALIALSAALWFVYQLLWTYIEVLQHREVPTLYWGDIILFLHLVPLMAAIAVRPNVQRDEYAARVGRLDFALLVVWWIYLYVLAVMPWQYALVDERIYTHNLNALYLVEKIVLLTALAAFSVGSTGHWRILYANLFGASLLYAASSYFANWAIARDSYYSGSLYDIPLAASIAWLALIGLWTRVDEPEKETRKTSAAYGLWTARIGMIAVLSVPLFAAWALLDQAVPPPVRTFRLILTLSAALALGVMAFVRQRLLDRELLHLLQHSRRSIDNLKDLQGQVIQSEKLASIGQLVGGAAHELNNPITAMLGYSDLLLSTPLNSEQHALAAKIGQQARRTRSLVASLLSFARPTPASKVPVDLNTLLRTAVKLAQPQGNRAEVRFDLAPNLPAVLGDSKQLLQVCLQVVGNALHRAGERGDRVLTIRTFRQSQDLIVEVCDDTSAVVTPTTTNAAESVGEDDSLGLSACLGIVQEHLGRIVCQPHPNGTTTVRIELPASPLAQDAPTRSAALLAASPPSA